MLISETNLRKVIKCLLLEEDENDYSKISFDEDEEEDQYAEYNSLLKKALSKWKAEISGKDEGKTLSKYEEFLDNIKLVLLNDPQDKNVSAEALHVRFPKGWDGDPNSVKGDQAIEGVDKNMISGKDAFKAWQLNAVKNPLVVVNVGVDNRPIDLDLLYHEVQHIGKNFIRFYIPDLNIEEVQKLIRDD